MNKQIRFIPALALAIAMLSIPTLATAEVDIDSIDVVAASLVFEGVGANVIVDFTCSPADGADAQVGLNLTLTQRSGGDWVAFGQNSLTTKINCTDINTDDGRHTQRLEVVVTSQLRTFRGGSAVVQSSASLVNFNTIPPNPPISEFIPGGTKEIQINKK
ncbi:MAG: hypothetical protein PHD43_00155 [Methylococcales bacterium]|nr:hypothetical protein [Methylococcales bacterium]